MTTFTFQHTEYTLDLPPAIVDMILAGDDYDEIESAALNLDYDEELDEYTGEYANTVQALYEGELRLNAAGQF